MGSKLKSISIKSVLACDQEEIMSEPWDMAEIPVWIVRECATSLLWSLNFSNDFMQGYTTSVLKHNYGSFGCK